MKFTQFIIQGVLFLMMIGAIHTAEAQRVLQMETRGKIEAEKFYIGDEISVQLNTDNFYRHSYILDVYPEKNEVEFDFGIINIDEIVALRTPRQLKRGANWRRALLIPGLSFILYTPLEFIYRDEPNWRIILFGGAIAALGIVLKPVFDKFSKHNIGKRKRLRVLDLSLPEPAWRP